MWLRISAEVVVAEDMDPAPAAVVVVSSCLIT